MIAELCHLLGWRWSEVEAEMTLPRLAAFNRAWRNTPPLPLLMKALLGYAPSRGEGSGKAQGPAEFLAWFRSQGGRKG